MNIVKPESSYLKDYYEAIKESYDNNIEEWKPYFLDSYEVWSQRIIALYEKCAKGEIEGYPQTYTYWAVENGRFIGEVQIRPYISKEEAETIGHIGYGVRYSMWKHGYGTKIVKAGIEMLWELGVNPVCIICNKTNEASKHTILKCGGTFIKDQIAIDGSEEKVYFVEKKG